VRHDSIRENNDVSNVDNISLRAFRGSNTWQAIHLIRASYSYDSEIYTLIDLIYSADLFTSVDFVVLIDAILVNPQEPIIKP
jgi:hypothetical protein